MAHTKAQGAVKGNRDSVSKRRGIKLYGGHSAKPGAIIVRQKGNKFFAGANVRQGKDFTLFAVSEGTVHFKTLQGKKIVEILNG